MAHSNQASTISSQVTGHAQVESEIGQQRRRCLQSIEVLEEMIAALTRRLYPVLRQTVEGVGAKASGDSPTPMLSEIAAEFYGIENRVQGAVRRVETLLAELALD